MTSKEFVLWLQGFAEGVHEYNISPKQWDILKAKLFEVNDEQPNFAGGEMGVPNTQPFPIWQEPHTYYPNGTAPSPGLVVTTTPGSSIGTITTSNGMGTGTTYGYPSGSAWSYTVTGYNPPYTTGEGLDDMKIQHNED